MLALKFLPLFLIPILIQAQALTAPPHPVFSPFRGPVFKMPIVEIKAPKVNRKGLQEFYAENIYDYEEIHQIELKELKIPETVIGEAPFPGGVTRKTRFAMVLNSEMTIAVDACYEFSLNSDDGSILWIAEEEVINNDGGHEMTLKKDSLVYKKGTYPIKLWYFQSLADRFGLIFDAKIVGKPEVCPKVASIPKMTLEFKSQILFESGKATLKAEAVKEIEQIAEAINLGSYTKVTVIGHTDNVGSEANNLALSKARSQSIIKALKTYATDSTLNFTSEGKGESMPISSNNTPDGRQENRRVEIILE